MENCAQYTDVPTHYLAYLCRHVKQIVLLKPIANYNDNLYLWNSILITILIRQFNRYSLM